MEAILYTFLLLATLFIIFFAIFFRDPPRIYRKKMPMTSRTSRQRRNNKIE